MLKTGGHEDNAYPVSRSPKPPEPSWAPRTSPKHCVLRHPGDQTSTLQCNDNNDDNNMLKEEKEESSSGGEQAGCASGAANFVQTIQCDVTLKVNETIKVGAKVVEMLRQVESIQLSDGEHSIAGDFISNSRDWRPIRGCGGGDRQQQRGVGGGC